MTSEKKDNKKPTVLIVGPLPPPPGGVATAVANLLQSDLRNTFKLLHVRTSNQRPNAKKGKMDLINILFFLKQFTHLAIVLMVSRPPIVQIESSMGISFLKNSAFVVLSKLLRRRVILSIYGNVRIADDESLYHQLSRPRQKHFRWVLQRCDKIKVESQKRKDFLEKILNIPSTKIWIIPNAVYLEKTAKRYNESGPVLLFIGWLDRNKGIFDLLESINRLKQKGLNLKIIIIGPEGRAGEYDKIIANITEKDIQSRIEVYKEKSHSELTPFYESADVFLLPSYFEGLPYTILEAMAHGLPVIATNVGAIPEVIEEGINGFLINPGDIDDLTKKIKTLITNKALIEEIGKNNRRKIADKYSMDKQVENYKNLYTSLL